MRRPYDKRAVAQDLASSYNSCFADSDRSAEIFDRVQTYCMFLGYSRSGHSLVGALLDAHPEMVIAHELDVLKYIQEGLGKREIYSLILQNSREWTRKGCSRSGYSYVVPNQWQGKYETISVIGDKKGGRSTRVIRDHPELLYQLRGVIEAKIKFVHVMRNPYDNISTRYLRMKKSSDLRRPIEEYFFQCETIANIKKEVSSEDIFDLRHESLIADPEMWLSKLCRFLGVEAPATYLTDCASIVYKDPHKSRYEAEWNRELCEVVQRKIVEFPFLQGYSFKD